MGSVFAPKTNIKRTTNEKTGRGKEHSRLPLGRPLIDLPTGTFKCSPVARRRPVRVSIGPGSSGVAPLAGSS
mgnify:CR=1 FL=1